MARRDLNNLAQYWRDRRVPGLTLLCADFTTQEFALHSHDALVIAVTETGGAEIKSRGEIHRAVSDSVFAFNPAEPHCGWMGWSRRWCYRSMYLTQSALDIVADGLDLQQIPYFTHNMIRDRALCASFLALHRALQDSVDALHEEELLLASFGTLFSRYGSSARRRAEFERHDNTLLARAIDLMKSRYDEPLTLDDLGAVVGLRKVQLIALFKRHVGMGPHAYLTQIRLGAACRRLKSGEPLAEIAAATGFYDQSAMNRHFKRAYGITPRQYAQAC
ncbi:MAG TPA: AraC family transcriptional regulator [Ferrovibrio sp.]|uniref:AraC family transcriptional regulator n=1 Tax=Ferrovibrio sp. TaxID=1917215 RepID=UPI002ED55D4B